MEEGHCIATVHAEANAILQAAMNGVRMKGGDYRRLSLWPCFKLIANAGLVAIYFGEFYASRGSDYAEKVGISSWTERRRGVSRSRMI